MSGDDRDSPGPSSPAESNDESVGEPERDAPLSELADRISERRRREASTGARADEGDETSSTEGASDAAGDHFDEMSVPEIDEETLWASLADDADGSPELRVGAEPVDGDATVRTSEAPEDGPTERVVSKESYCQRCPYLADPPELACTHEGTEILEVVDSERFRVRECPMVEE
jgi:hypothetical protein